MTGIKRYLVAFGGFALPAHGGIDTIPWQPHTTPQQWCESMPCTTLFSTDIIVDQLSSTLLVYVLGLVWIWAGWRFWRAQNGQKSRQWWATAMLLGGVAAIAAGTSYQAFGYELKCAGQEICRWTSWWEIAYLSLQSASMNAMLTGVAYACATGAFRQWLIIYAAINLLAHLTVIAIGIGLSERFLISFEMSILFSAPTFFVYLIVNGRAYYQRSESKDKVLIGAWLLMIMINTSYYLYLLSGMTEKLWALGLWFSANDVLHVLMLGWVVYIGTTVLGIISDRRLPPLPPTTGNQ